MKQEVGPELDLSVKELSLDSILLNSLSISSISKFLGDGLSL